MITLAAGVQTHVVDVEEISPTTRCPLRQAVEAGSNAGAHVAPLVRRPRVLAARAAVCGFALIRRAPKCPRRNRCRNNARCRASQRFGFSCGKRLRRRLVQETGLPCRGARWGNRVCRPQSIPCPPTHRRRQMFAHQRLAHWFCTVVFTGGGKRNDQAAGTINYGSFPPPSRIACSWRTPNVTLEHALGAGACVSRRADRAKEPHATKSMKLASSDRIGIIGIFTLNQIDCQHQKARP